MTTDVLEASVHETCLNWLPVEVLDLVFLQIPVSDLCPLLRDASFTENNPNVTMALKKKLLEGNYIVLNRVVQPLFVEMYLLTPSHLDKRSLEFLHSSSDVVDILNFNHRYPYKARHPITLSYYIWHLCDMYDLIMLIRLSAVPSLLLFNVELEYDPGILHYMSLNVALDYLAGKLADRVVSLMVLNYTGDLPYDFNVFPSLQTLWLENTNVRFKASFRNLPNLKHLVIYPNYNGYTLNNPVVLLKSLPPSVETLRIGNCIANGRSLRYPSPTKIKNLHMTNVQDVSNQYLRELLSNNVNTHLESLCLENISMKEPIFDCVVEICAPLVHSSTGNLSLLSLFNFEYNDLCNWDFMDTNLTELRLSKCSIRDVKVPSTLQKLDLSENGIVNLFDMVVPGLLPKGLKYLNLSHNPINWRVLPEVEFTPNIETLSLKNTMIRDQLYKLKFPDSVTYLSLEINQIESIDGIKFPKNISNLGIGGNHLRAIKNPTLPLKLRTLHLTENNLSGPIDLSVDENKQPLNMEVLYLNYNSIHSLSDLRFAKTITILNLDNCKLTELVDVVFQRSIVELSLSGCSIKQVRNVSFEAGSQCRYFNLSQNSISELHPVRSLRLPENIEIFNLGSNKLRSLLADFFKECRSLVSLKVSANQMSKLDLCLSEKIRMVDVSFNQLRHVRLRFPKNSQQTEFLSINLSKNKLTSFGPETISHGVDGVFHGKLTEVDLTENKITSQEMKDKLGKLPTSLRALFVGRSGLQDRYGYDIGSNIVESLCCMGKRIDYTCL